MAVTWTQADADTLKAAIASGVREVEYDGPPKRRVRYHDLEQMRSLYAEMVRQLCDSPTHRIARHTKGFR